MKKMLVLLSIVILITVGCSSPSNTVSSSDDENNTILKEICITHSSSKIHYGINECFKPDGLEITAIYENGSSKIVTNYSNNLNTSSIGNKKTLLISYTEHKITKTTSYLYDVEYGTKSAGNYAVGDIVFSDGSLTPYSEISLRTNKKCSDLEKANAVAVIFKVDKDSPILGVGLKRSSNYTTWCTTDAQGNNKKFSTDDSVIDGSETLQKMKNELENDLSFYNDMTGCDKYPAFWFADRYGITKGHNTINTLIFHNGWYLPSISELQSIYTANQDNNVIDNAISAAGGDIFGTSNYLSSSQSSDDVYSAYYFAFTYGFISNQKKSNYAYMYACAIKHFN